MIVRYPFYTDESYLFFQILQGFPCFYSFSSYYSSFLLQRRSLTQSQMLKSLRNPGASFCQTLKQSNKNYEIIIPLFFFLILHLKKIILLKRIYIICVIWIQNKQHTQTIEIAFHVALGKNTVWIPFEDDVGLVFTGLRPFFLRKSRSSFRSRFSSFRRRFSSFSNL